jgi:hypothetical protein
MTSLYAIAKNVYLKFSDLIAPESWWGRSLLWLALAPFMYYAFSFFSSAIAQGQVRRLLLWFLGSAVALTILNTIDIRFKLQRKGSSAVAQAKLWAEIFAGCALLGFVGQFFQLGSSLDYLLPDPRPARFAVIAEKMNVAAGCSKSSDAMCKVLGSNLKQLETHIAQKSESDASQNITDLRHYLQSPEFTKRSTQPSQQIDHLSDELAQLDRYEELLPRIVQILPVLSLLFASLAISSKIAIAWNDKKTLKPKPAEASHVPQDAVEPAPSPPAPLPAEAKVPVQNNAHIVASAAIALTAIVALAVLANTTANTAAQKRIE